jgi:hypothetical protein
MFSNFGSRRFELFFRRCFNLPVSVVQQRMQYSSGKISVYRRQPLDGSDAIFGPANNFASYAALPVPDASSPPVSCAEDGADPIALD